MYSIIFSLCVLLLFALIVFWNYKKHSQSDMTREDYLQNLNNLRGIFALEIVIGHVIRYEHSLLYPMGKFMICSVAFFFFMSSFGMALSFEKKNDYLNTGFLRSKPLYLLILSMLVFMLNMGIDAVCPNDLSYLTPPLLHTYIMKTNWYIWSQILFYFLFFFTYKFWYKFRIPVIVAVTVLLTIVMYMNGFPEGWWASSFAFPLGLIVGEHFSATKQFLFSRKGVLTVIALCLFGFSCLFVPTETIVSFVFMRNAMCLAAIMILLYICSYLTLGNNVVTGFLNKYSTEIYLLQFIWLRLTESYGLNYMIRMPIVLIATIVSAMLFHPLVLLIKRQLK